MGGKKPMVMTAHRKTAGLKIIPHGNKPRQKNIHGKKPIQMKAVIIKRKEAVINKIIMCI